MNLEEFKELITGGKIVDCYLANTAEEKEHVSGLSEHGKQRVMESRQIKYERNEADSVVADFDYGIHRFILELENGKKIQFTGSEWNQVVLITG